MQQHIYFMKQQFYSSNMSVYMMVWYATNDCMQRNCWFPFPCQVAYQKREEAYSYKLQRLKAHDIHDDDKTTKNL